MGLRPSSHTPTPDDPRSKIGSPSSLVISPISQRSKSGHRKLSEIGEENSSSSGDSDHLKRRTPSQLSRSRTPDVGQHQQQRARSPRMSDRDGGRTEAGDRERARKGHKKSSTRQSRRKSPEDRHTYASGASNL